MMGVIIYPIVKRIFLWTHPSLKSDPLYKRNHLITVTSHEHHGVPYHCSLYGVLISSFGMMTSSNRDNFRVIGLLCGEFTGPGEFPAQWPVTRNFDVFFDLCPNKQFSKQSWGWRFETPSCPLWRHCNGLASRRTLKFCITGRLWGESPDHYWIPVIMDVIIFLPTESPCLVAP